ncbi:MAG: OmpA family protein [Candidatus Symbiothrix sp.]|jgi:outer membrane protein OmpA-like peptidoglycan-associated protein|nr:OmpA family protein [Candidatus Symbiothrix sp.]
MKAKIRVYGKDQNRTALGIVNAFVALNPEATLTDLQRAFPYSINPVGSEKETVVPIAVAAGKPEEFFEKPSDLITLKDGEKVSIKYLWEKPYFEKLVEYVKQFGIEAANCTETPPFQEGSYRLAWVDKESPKPQHARTYAELWIVVPVVEEIIVTEEAPKHEVHHAQTHHAAAAAPKAPVHHEEEKKKCNWWPWLLLLLLLALLALLLCKKCKGNEDACCGNKEVPYELVAENVPVYDANGYWGQKIATATVTQDGYLEYGKDGKLVDITIDDQTIQFDALSTEAEILAFLNSDLKVSPWIVLDNIHFQFNKVDFSPAALAQIQNVTSILKKYAPNATIALEGFADHIGTTAENKAISDKRAVDTKGHFVADTYPADHITSAVGLSDTNRLCQADDTPLCRLQNRRVEIQITK